MKDREYHEANFATFVTKKKNGMKEESIIFQICV